MNIKKYFGPSTLVTAAFIGPGTITTCTLAGINTGSTLLWALVFAIVATIILQEMSARLGLVTGAGLGSALNRQFSSGILRWIVYALCIGAILIGNAAYEAGNITGGVLGLTVFLEDWQWWPLVIGVVCGSLLWYGRYVWIERFLLGTVILMSISFIVTLFIIKPDWSEVFKGFIPTIPSADEMVLLLAVIGTTVVPYNLFLQSSTVSEKWKSTSDLKDLRIENAIAIGLGGLISIMIVITAAASRTEVQSITNVADMAVQLEPLYGKSASLFLGIGLLAAGISSALTAPMAAAYAARGLFGWSKEVTTEKFRFVWLCVLLSGIIVSFLDLNAILVIKFAQVTNAILLPFIAIFLVQICNSEKIMGPYKNSVWTNALALIVVSFTFLLSFRTLNNLFSLL